MSEKKEKSKRRTLILPHYNNADLSAWIQTLCQNLNFDFETLLGFIFADFCMAMQIAIDRSPDPSAPFMAYLENVIEHYNNYQKYITERSHGKKSCSSPISV